LTKKANFENIYEYLDAIEYVLSNNNRLKYIEERQQLKKYNNYFNSYEKIEDIVFLSKKEDILKIMERKQKNIESRTDADFIEGFKAFFREKLGGL
jgi:hypothetical protein